MTFTYAGTLATDLDNIRFQIQDTVSGSGPKPADANFTDEELNGLKTVEGTWQRTVAACYEVLGNAWAKHPDFTADGTTARQGQIADHYRKQAAEWRKRFGYGTASVGYRTVTRADAYSDDLDNVETEALE